MQKIDDEFLITNRLVREWTDDFILIMRCVEKYLDATWSVPEEEGTVDFFFKMDIGDDKDVPLRGNLNETLRYDCGTPEFQVIDMSIDGVYDGIHYKSSNRFRTRFLSTHEFMNLYLQGSLRWFHSDYCNTSITSMPNDALKAEIRNHISELIDSKRSLEAAYQRKKAFLKEHFHELPVVEEIYDIMTDINGTDYVEAKLRYLRHEIDKVARRK